MGYPGSAKKNKEYTQDDLVNVIVNDLNNDIDEQKIAFKLSSFYSVDPMEAMQLVNQVQDYLNNADDSEEEDDDDEIKNQNIVEEEIPEEEIVDDTNEEESAALANDSTGIDLALEEEEIVDDEEYSYGGMYKAQEGEEVNTEISQNFQTPSYPFNSTAPEITFPSIDTYLPFNISDMLDGTIDPATGIYANYYDNEDDVVEEDVEEDTEDISEYALDTPPEMKMGGNYKRNKKAYVNSIIKLSKKADGGEEVKSDEDPEAGDPTGAKIRKQKLNNFIGSLKKETEMFNLKQQAEQQYDQMMQQQQPQNDMMRRGGSAGSKDPKVVRGNELRYRANQLRDFITGQNRRDGNEDMYNYNQQPISNIETSEDENYNRNINNEKNYYNYPSYRVDVRKSNWLTGRPSKYTIDFYGNSPLMNIAKGNIITSNIPKSNVSNNSSSKNTSINTISKVINKQSTIKIDADIKNKSQVLSNDFYTKDDNKDLIPDYLQPGIMSGLSTNLSKDVFTQAAVDAVNNLSSIKSNVIPKSNVIIPQVPVKPIIPIKPIPLTIIKPKVISKGKAKDKTKSKNKIKYEDDYRDPTYYEQLQRFFGAGPMETGGYVDSENPDLYEFNQGGYDPTQQDIDYSNSIDTTDPYFQRGGGVRKFIENYFPGNILSPQRTYRNEIQRVYDPRTGKTVNMPIDMGRLSSVDVQKSRFWSGKPKKYTMYFNGSTSKPVLTSNNSSSQSGHDRFCEMFPDSPMCTGIKKRDAQWNTTDGLGLKSRMAIRKGERQNKRNSRRLERQGLDEYGNRPGDEQGAIYNGDGKLVRNAEGDYFDRYNEKIPGKKRPSDMENWWQNDRYFKQNTKNNEPMSNEELFKSQGKTYDPILKKWLTADQKTAINMLNPESSIKNESLIKDESGNLKEQLQSNGIYNYKQLKKDFNEQDLEPLIKESKEKKYKKLISESPWEALEYKAAYNANMEHNKVWNEVNDKINSGQEVDPELTQLLKDKSDVAEKLRRAYSKYIITSMFDAGYYKGKTLDDFEDYHLNFLFYDDMIDNNKLQEKLKEKTPAVEEDGTKFGNKQYGGNLDKYLPRADTGFQTTLNPGDCPTGSSKNAAGDCVDFMGKVVKKRNTGSDFGNNTPEIKQPPEIKLPGVMDETYKNPLTGEKPGVIRGADGNLKINQETPSFYGDQYAVDVENKRNRGKLAFGNKADTSRSETRLGAFNTGVDIVDSLKRNIDSRKSENQMYENLSSNNLYASDPSRDRGDYDTNSGLYRPDDQGQMWDSRSKQFGGYIDEEEYYDPYTEEDELTYAKGGEKITYMSEDQIRAFMAEGGQVEFL